MKILYYSSHPYLNMASPSGYGTHMREMIAAFRLLGHEVKPLIMGGSTLINDDYTIKGRGSFKNFCAQCIPSYVWESAKDYKLKRFDENAFCLLEQEIKTFQPELIYERAAYLQTSGIRAANKWGVKHILEVNAPYVAERIELQGKSFFSEEGLKIEKEQLEKAFKVVVVSTALKKHLVSTYKIGSEKFVVTPNAINPKQIKNDFSESEILRSDLGLVGKNVIGFVGSIFPWHGVDILIESFGRLIKAGKKDCHLLIVGDGETLPVLREQVNKAGLAEKVIFTGNVPHVKVFSYLQVMDICVMGKSNWYGSPVKIFEYGAMGKAIIAPDNGPVRDVCKHMENAVLVQPNVESIYEALTLLLSDDHFRIKLAKSFQKVVLTQHTWFANAEKVLADI